jgi:flagella basal body P-ring formation protein FlgA
MRRLGLLALGAALATLPVTLPSLSWAGAPAILRQDVTVSSSRVTLGDLFADAGQAAGIVVARVQPGQTAVLDATQVQFVARSNGVDWGNPAGLRRITVQSNLPAPEAPRAAEARKAAKAPAVLAYLHSLNAGEIVRAEDLTWSRDAVAGMDSPRDPEAVIGMAARRPLREGDAVSLRDMAAPLVIKKDDMVAVTFNQAGLSLTLEAKAMADAAAGQLVTVMNPASKKVIQAVAAGPGQAVVGPEADQLKAALRLQSASALSSSRLALR